MTTSKHTRRRGGVRNHDVLAPPYYNSLLDACIDLIRIRDIVRDLGCAHKEIPESLLHHLVRLHSYVDERLSWRPNYKLNPRNIRQHVWKWPKGGWAVPRGQ